MCEALDVQIFKDIMVLYMQIPEELLKGNAALKCIVL